MIKFKEYYQERYLDEGWRDWARTAGQVLAPVAGFFGGKAVGNLVGGEGDAAMAMSAAGATFGTLLSFLTGLPRIAGSLFEDLAKKVVNLFQKKDIPGNKDAEVAKSIEQNPKDREMIALLARINVQIEKHLPGKPDLRGMAKDKKRQIFINYINNVKKTPEELERIIKLLNSALKFTLELKTKGVLAFYSEREYSEIVENLRTMVEFTGNKLDLERHHDRERSIVDFRNSMWDKKKKEEVPEEISDEEVPYADEDMGTQEVVDKKIFLRNKKYGANNYIIQSMLDRGMSKDDIVKWLVSSGRVKTERAAKGLVTKALKLRSSESRPKTINPSARPLGRDYL